MKKIILTLVTVAFLATSQAQTSFDKFEEMDNVTSVIINKNMFKMLSSMSGAVGDKEAKDFMELAKTLENLRVFTTEDKKASADMLSSFNSYLKNSKLDELMRVKDGDNNVKFYVKPGKTENLVNELLMFVETKDSLGKQRTVLMSLTGLIDLNKLSALTDKMNIPGGEQLKKGGKSKSNE
ncbi:MAG: DUF4252 domain-containing protein [Flavobacteriaceae bacterium]|nr:DUF4252 domain-containing protein [Flavobacteriaceae bacterium]MDZ4148805.1 DUF4252 domain-containing protein [Flavobacteriaceae bacterium]